MDFYNSAQRSSWVQMVREKFEHSALITIHLRNQRALRLLFISTVLNASGLSHKPSL